MDHSSSARITADTVRWHPFPFASKDRLQLHKYMHPGLELLETREERRERLCQLLRSEMPQDKGWPPVKVVHPEGGF